MGVGKKATGVVREVGGVPTLVVNGRAVGAMAYMTFHLQERYVREFAEAGVELFSFTTTSDYDYYRLAATAWKGPGEFDYRQFDERMEMILRAAPQGMVFPRIYLCSPAWWDRLHPEELMRGKDGVYGPPMDMGWLDEKVKETSLGPEKLTVPSFSSQLWLKESGEALRRFVSHAEEKFGHRIVGYHLVSGGSQEWYWWGGFEDVFADESGPHRKAFGQWRKRECEMRSAKCEMGEGIPTVAERAKGEVGVLRDVREAGARRGVDYWRFHAEAVVAALGHFAKVTREVIGREKFIGAFYGYFVDLQRHKTCWHNSGHLALGRALADENIDFLTSPTAYKDRRVGDGVSVFNSLTETISAHGKLWWDENDILTDLAPKLKDKLFLVPRDAVESRHLQRREFANALCHGAGMWWFDMWGGYHADAAKMADVKRMREIGDRSVAFDRRGVAEVAVVLDDKSICYTECDNRLTVPLVSEQLMEMGHVGAPFAMVHADDLERVGPFKMYLFVGVLWADAARRTMVRRVLEKNGATGVFVYGAGLVSDEGVDVRGMEEMTGMKLALEMGERMIRVDAQRGEWRGEYGAEKMLEPMVRVVEETGVEVMGKVVGTEWVGLARKKVGASWSVVSSAVRLPAGLLKALMRQAGVHVWTEGGENVYANRSFVAVCGRPGAKVNVRVQGDEALYDLFARREVKVAGGVAELAGAEDGVYVLFRGPGKGGFEP